MKLKVLTVMTNHNGYSKLLESQLQNFNIEYKLLGFGEVWKGWDWRAKLLKEELKETDETKYIVAIIDGFDVLLLEDEETILQKYKECNKDVVISMNTIKKDSNNLNIIIMDSFHRLLNGGIYIGNPKRIIELFDLVNQKYEKRISKKKFDDEIELNRFIKDESNKKWIDKYLHFDTESKLVYTDNPGHYMYYKKNPINIVDGKVVCEYKSSFIHTMGHFDEEIIKYFHLRDKDYLYGNHRIKLNIKNLVQGVQYLNVVLLIFVVLVLVIID